MKNGIVICLVIMFFFCNAGENTISKKSYFSSQADRETFLYCFSVKKPPDEPVSSRKKL